jgi:hypothetical protein
MEPKVNVKEDGVLSWWDTIRMIFYYRRPDFIPSSAAQRAFQHEVDMILSGSPKSQGFRSLTAPIFTIPSELTYDTMMAGKTAPVCVLIHIKL